MVKTYAYGFPRIGKNREYKKYIESFWKGQIHDIELNEEFIRLEDQLYKSYERGVHTSEIENSLGL